MKLSKILKEVLSELNVPKPEDAYKFDKILKKDLGYGTMHTYVYTNQNGDQMEISNMVTKHPKEPGKSIYIAFKKYDPTEPDEEEYDSDEEQEKKYSEKTGAQDFIKVLATVVQATKNTMKKEGGDNSIYAIKFSPSDKKRASIYMHYIGTLFPDFEEKDQEGMFTSFVNKNFKEKVISEIGDSSAGTYPTKEKSTPRGTNYRFNTDYKDPKTGNLDSTPYEIEIVKWGPDGINVQFGVLPKKGAKVGASNLKIETNRGEVYKVMATVADCVRKELAKNPEIKEIYFEPSKKDGQDLRRFKLYMAYFEKQLKPKKVNFDGDSAMLTIK